MPNFAKSPYERKCYFWWVPPPLSALTRPCRVLTPRSAPRCPPPLAGVRSNKNIPMKTLRIVCQSAYGASGGHWREWVGVLALRPPCSALPHACTLTRAHPPLQATRRLGVLVSCAH